MNNECGASPAQIALALEGGDDAVGGAPARDDIEPAVRPAGSIPVATKAAAGPVVATPLPRFQVERVGPVTAAQTSSIRATTDAQAIEAWLAARCDPAADALSGRVGHTARTYRREANRFLLWLQVERGVSLDGASLEDCVAYRDFLADPQPRARWCAPVGAPIGSAQWRPFVGPLAPRSRRQAMVIVSGLYRFLQDQRYLAGNPVTGVSMPRGSSPRVDPGRSLTKSQWHAVECALRHCAASDLEAGRAATGERGRLLQVAWAVRFLYATGLRLAEIVAADCGDLEWVEFDDADHDAPADAPELLRGGWIIRVTGKGLKLREVPVPGRLVEELGQRLARVGGGSADPRNHGTRPLLVSRDPATSISGAEPRPSRLSSQGLYRQLKRLFALVARQLAAQGRDRDAKVLERASTHWLRHTCGSHAVADGVPVDVVQQNLGHGSLATTTIYCTSELTRRVRESARLGAARER